MPRSRNRGGTRIPRSGDDTTLPAMLISPDVGCSSPATQRSVVVLPQPEGPSRTTISPAGTPKLTPSTAGLPVAKRLTRLSMSRAAVTCGGSLAIAVGLVPLLEPRLAQRFELLEIRHPHLDDLGVPAFGEAGRL